MLLRVVAMTVVVLFSLRVRWTRVERVPTVWAWVDDRPGYDVNCWDVVGGIV